MAANKKNNKDIWKCNSRFTERAEVDVWEKRDRTRQIFFSQEASFWLLFSILKKLGFRISILKKKKTLKVLCRVNSVILYCRCIIL